jgi:hypothetical protein
MRNLPRNLLASWLAVLLVSSVACTKASFEQITSGGAGGSGGDAGSSGGGGQSADAGGSGGASSGPEAGVVCPEVPLVCSATTAGSCDPVCQIGNCNWCTEKCTYAFDGVREQPTCASKGQKTVLQQCTLSSAGLPTQNDECAPGNICLAPTIGDNLTYCFSLCVSKADCTNVACGQRPLSAAGGSVSVCDPPYDQCGVDGTCCDPISGAGCPAHRVCLLVSRDPGTNHSRTVCELAYGNGRNGVTCDSSRDCYIGNACVPDSTCRQVCNSANDCPNSGVCTMWGTEYGYCPY